MSLDPAPAISVIIPVWNEKQTLGEAIDRVRVSPVRHEIIVADGGSNDGSVALAKNAGARVIEGGRRQRAAQMNAGAAQARSEILLFLHADTFLPPGALALIAEALRDPQAIGGAFQRRYDSPSRFLTATCRLAAWRNRWLGWHLGDQAMFVRREVFQNCGGFMEADRFEDLDLSRRLARRGRLVTLEPAILTSSRRFLREGPVRRTLLDLLLTLRYLCRGVHVGKS